MTRHVRKPVFALFTALLLSACGVDYPEGEPLGDPGSPGQAQQAANNGNPGQPGGPSAQVGHLPTVVAEARAQGPKLTEGPWDVTLSGRLNASEGTPAHLAAAILGCGYYIADTDQTVVSGQSVTLTGEKAFEQWGGKLFLFLDNDRDGRCDAEAGDGLFEADVSNLAGPAQVSTSQLAPLEGWYCMFFNGYGS